MPTKSSSPISPGFHSLSSHLVIRDTAGAIEFYKKVFGAQEIMRMPSPDGKIMHAELKVGDSILMLCGEFPEMGVQSPTSLNGSAVTIHYYTENADEVFDRAVKAGAEPIMPLMDAFWGDRYGKLRDPFGHLWSIATHQYDLTPEEMGRAAAEAMSGGCGEANKK